MKKPRKAKSLTLFDVAAGPMYLVLFGVPVAIVAAVALLVYIAGKLIERARDRNQDKQDK